MQYWEDFYICSLIGKMNLIKLLVLEYIYKCWSLSYIFNKSYPYCIITGWHCRGVDICRAVFVLWTKELMNQFLKNHQLNKAEIGVTDESISDWISGSQDTFSSTALKIHRPLVISDDVVRILIRHFCNLQVVRKFLPLTSFLDVYLM